VRGSALCIANITDVLAIYIYIYMYIDHIDKHPSHMLTSLLSQNGKTPLEYAETIR